MTCNLFIATTHLLGDIVDWAHGASLAAIFKPMVLHRVVMRTSVHHCFTIVKLLFTDIAILCPTFLLTQKYPTQFEC